jgi:hypothetical protein
MSLFNLFIWNEIIMLMGNYRFMIRTARCSFHRKFSFKKCSVYSIIVPTCMSGTSDFIIKNLYPTL